MNDCPDLIAHFHAQASDHVRLAMIAEAPPVAEMHLDLALFSGAQARTAEELCDED